MRVRTYSDFSARAWLVTFLIFFGVIFLLAGGSSKPPNALVILEGLALISAGIAIIVIYPKLTRPRARYVSRPRAQETYFVRRAPARSRGTRTRRSTTRASTTTVQLSSRALEGVLDPVTGTEFRRDDEITQCSNCGLFYHSDSRQFILEQNSGRCVGCSQSGTLQIVRAVEAVSVKRARATRYRANIVTLDNYQDFLGKIVYFEGRVVEVHESTKGTYFVKFVRGPIPKVFKLVVFSQYVDRFSQGGRTIEHYRGRTIRVRGLIKRHEVWGWEILVFKEEAISLVS